MNGIVLIDKPQGPSSFDVVKRVRYLAKTKKVGHAGTLDPLASGLLMVCLGRYTKLASILTDGEKIYEAIISLGTTTTTDDNEGEAIRTESYAHITRAQIENAINQFVGSIEQKPPQFSAIKVGGKRAYALARANTTVELAPRPVTIFSITIVDIDLPNVKVSIHCSKGTYVRSLARDVGDALGVGAHAQDIRRIKSGNCLVENAIPFDQLNNETIEKNLTTGYESFGIESVILDEYETEAIRQGRKLSSPLNMIAEVGLAVHLSEPVAILRKVDGVVRAARVI